MSTEGWVSINHTHRWLVTKWQILCLCPIELGPTQNLHIYFKIVPKISFNYLRISIGENLLPSLLFFDRCNSLSEEKPGNFGTHFEVINWHFEV